MIPSVIARPAESVHCNERGFHQVMLPMFALLLLSAGNRRAALQQTMIGWLAKGLGDGNKLHEIFDDTRNPANGGGRAGLRLRPQ